MAATWFTWNPSADAWLLTCYGVLATVAFLSHKRLVAIHAVELVFDRGEALPTQLLGASGTHKALGMVRLILVGDASRSDGLKRNQPTNNQC